jgi:hypothetical protein
VEPSRRRAAQVESDAAVVAEVSTPRVLTAEQPDPWTQRWTLALPRDGKPELSGTLTVIGLPTEVGGQIPTIEWRVTEEIVSGIVKDAGGNAVASFSGRLRAGGVTGTVRLKDGPVGSWRWDGPLD